MSLTFQIIIVSSQKSLYQLPLPRRGGSDNSIGKYEDTKNYNLQCFFVEKAREESGPGGLATFFFIWELRIIEILQPIFAWEWMQLCKNKKANFVKRNLRFSLVL